MRDAKRALRANPAHAPRLKGATTRKRSTFSRRSVPAGQLRFSSACFTRSLPQAAFRRMGLFLCRISCGNALGAKTFLPSVVRRTHIFPFSGGAPRGSESNPFKSPKIPVPVCAPAEGKRDAYPPVRAPASSADADENLRRKTSIPFSGGALRGSESNPFKSRKSLFVFARATETRTFPPRFSQKNDAPADLSTRAPNTH